MWPGGAARSFLGSPKRGSARGGSLGSPSCAPNSLQSMLLNLAGNHTAAAAAANESRASGGSYGGYSAEQLQQQHLLELTCGWQDLSHMPHVQVKGGVSSPAVCSVRERDDEEELPSQEDLEDSMKLPLAAAADGM